MVSVVTKNMDDYIHEYGGNAFWGKLTALKQEQSWEGAMDIPLELLTMSKKLSRSPDEYKAKAAHVNLAIRINKERGRGMGSWRGREYHM